MKYNIPAVVFSGGKSSRMKEDKALLPFGDHPTLAAYQYDRLKILFETVYLSGKSDKFNIDAPVLLDSSNIYSPMVGLNSVLRQIDNDACFVLSVDTPFVDNNIIKTLMECKKETPKQYDAVIARNFGKVQPLCAIYRRSILPAIEEDLSHNAHKLGKLLQKVRCCYVDFEEEDAFMNLNHPHEYQKALRLSKI
ncbi:Molybdopterin-guanine dinucleotide biosynthesis protein MobA [hydrothermal vent metagenome]|uniref:Molybdopterin-guanine dinucleotide biosynthesis protein MobA n=1 Tax=hydrothermal vent metagenome TaxID=652676 RepID=A0A1W1E9B2_9ZZZZ